MRYEIEQSTTGVVLGVYEGETAAAAIAAMMADASSASAPDAGLVAREVDDVVHAWDSEEYAYADGDADGIDDYFTVGSFIKMFGGTAPSTEAMAALRAAAHAALDGAEEPAVMTVRVSEFEKVVVEDEEGVASDHPDFEAVLGGELDTYGVRARVILHIPVGDGGHPEYDGGPTVATQIQTPGVWGITAHHTCEPHIDDHYQAEAALLAVMLRALGVEVVEDRMETGGQQVEV